MGALERTKYAEIFGKPIYRQVVLKDYPKTEYEVILEFEGQKSYCNIPLEVIESFGRGIIEQRTRELIDYILSRNVKYEV